MPPFGFMSDRWMREQSRRRRKYSDPSGTYALASDLLNYSLLGHTHVYSTLTGKPDLSVYATNTALNALDVRVTALEAAVAALPTFTTVTGISANLAFTLLINKQTVTIPITGLLTTDKIIEVQCLNALPGNIIQAESRIPSNGNLAVSFATPVVLSVTQSIPLRFVYMRNP